jgi:imidazolonepropionase
MTRPPVTTAAGARAASGPVTTVIENVHVATMQPGAPYGAVRDAAIALAGELVAWVGPRAECPAAPAARRVDARGRWATPGLVDCHTHLVYAGNRAAEFEMRLAGATYEEIARAGGGIVSTVQATRAATEEALLAQALRRVDALRREGVTTLEVKSGYGLEAAAEAKMLRVARAIGRERPLTVRTTFLGAHALPPEYAGRADDYVEAIVESMLPQVAAEGLADAVDAFCERIAFTADQTRRVFEAAKRHGLPVKLHADQLSDGNGALLAARHGALSADHLEYTNAAGVAAMAQAGTVAVLLPGAFYFLREKELPPVETLRRHGVPMAIATDCNPGSSPIASLLLMLSMACTLFRLTPEEALAGVTRNAALALGLGDRGTIAPGLVADLAFWDIGAPAELAYQVCLNACVGVWRSGQPVFGAP